MEVLVCWRYWNFEILRYADLWVEYAKYRRKRLGFEPSWFILIFIYIYSTYRHISLFAEPRYWPTWSGLIQPRNIYSRWHTAECSDSHCLAPKSGNGLANACI